MKRSVLIISYFSILTFTILLSSCVKEPLVPGGIDQSKTDTTWVDSSGGFDFDYTPYGNSGVWDDSTWTNPNDSTGTNPNDSTGTNNGGFDFDFTPHGGSGVWDSTWTNPNDSTGGGN
jgi:hypothetical protein